MLYFDRSCLELNRLPGKRPTNNETTIYLPEISHSTCSQLPGCARAQELQPAIQRVSVTFYYNLPCTIEKQTKL